MHTKDDRFMQNVCLGIFYSQFYLSARRRLPHLVCWSIWEFQGQFRNFRRFEIQSAELQFSAIILAGLFKMMAIRDSLDSSLRKW